MTNFELGQNNIDAMTKYGIPGYMQGGIVRYFENRIPPAVTLIASARRPTRCLLLPLGTRYS